VGIVGKDILMENEPDIYELLDLDIGKCRMCVAGPVGFEYDQEKTLRVATKYVNVAKRHFMEENRDIEIIKLNGSIGKGFVKGVCTHFNEVDFLVLFEKRSHVLSNRIKRDHKA
jgi:ATP phosphoribosyltransferase